MVLGRKQIEKTLLTNPPPPNRAQRMVQAFTTLKLSKYRRRNKKIYISAPHAVYSLKAPRAGSGRNTGKAEPPLETTNPRIWNLPGSVGNRDILVRIRIRNFE
jgi:hypothetical protein